MSIDQLEELLLAISYKGEDLDIASNAFKEVYQAYSKFLYAIVRKKLSKMGYYDDEVISATVNNTFLTVYENPLAFRVPENEVSDGCFKAWLTTVAKNELLKLFTEYYKSNNVLTSNNLEPAFEDTEIDLEIKLSANSKIMAGALDSLSERDREILLTLYNYQEEGKNTPSVVLDAICQRFGTTKDNIRKIKQRSETKIIDYFSKHSQLKPVK